MEVLTLTLYDAAGVSVWTEDQTVDFDNGYFVVDLGAVTPLDDSVLDQDDLSLGLTIGTGAELDRLPIRSVPFARRAGTATNVSGGSVDASEIRVGGTLVVDSSGSLVAPAPGDTLTNLGCLSNNQLPLFDGSAWGCSDLGWAQLGGVPAGFADGVDDDTLASTACVDGQILIYTAGSWVCGDDQDTQIDEAQVDSWVGNNGFAALSDLTALDGRVSLNEGSITTLNDTVVTNAVAVSALDSSLATVAKTGDYFDLLNRPAGLDDGDDDTQLDAATVVSYVDAADHYVLNTGDALTGGLTVTGGLGVSGGLSADTMQTGPAITSWSGQVTGRGDSGADDVWWIGDITPPNYNNAGLIVEVCNAARWRNPGCSTTLVGFGRYDGGASGVPGDSYSVELKSSSASHLAIPIRVSYGPGNEGVRPLKVWAEIGTTSGARYQTVSISVRGIGSAASFVPGDFSRDAVSNLTLLNSVEPPINVPTVQRHTSAVYDSTTNGVAPSRTFTFEKRRADTTLKLTWFDNFRCAGDGVACRWDVLIDGELCVSPSPLRQDMYNATTGAANLHYGMTVTGVCAQLANGAPLGAGPHTLEIREGASPSHTHGSPVLGWNWADDGVQAYIEVEEIY